MARRRLAFEAALERRRAALAAEQQAEAASQAAGDDAAQQEEEPEIDLVALNEESRKLLNTLIEESRSRGCKLIKWQVLDWNTKAIDFYEDNNAEIEKGWYNVKYWLD